MTLSNSGPERGFTLIELLVTVGLMGILASVAIPMTVIVVKRNHEQELRENLRSIRTAIDMYKQATEQGLVRRNVDESGYPHTLEELEDGVPNLKDSKGGPLRFLRRVPRDPMNDDLQITSSKTWWPRCYESSYASPQPGRDIFDVHSRSTEIGLNGVPYNEW